VYYLDNKVSDIIDARCNHEVHCKETSGSTKSRVNSMWLFSTCGSVTVSRQDFLYYNPPKTVLTPR